MRKDAALAKLTQEQQAELFDWLSTDTYESVLNRLAKPPPDGFGIKTHITSLHRFYEERQAQIRVEDFALAAAALASGAIEVGPILKASQAALAHSIYLLANSPCNRANLRTVARALYQQEDTAVKREYLEVARQQLTLARERLLLERAEFEYNAARTAMALLPELNAIDELHDIDDEAKIWRVRDRLFGNSAGGPPPPDALASGSARVANAAFDNSKKAVNP